MHSVMVVSHVSVMWGAQRRLLDLGPRLLEHGFELTLAAPAGDFTAAWTALGLPTRELSLPHHRGIRTDDRGRPGLLATAREIGVLGRSATTIARLARQHDLVQSHSLFAHVESGLAGRLVRRPVVLDVHDIVAPGLGRSLLRTAGRLATATIANSRATSDLLGGVDDERVFVVNPGVDTTRFHPGPVDPRVRAELSAHPDSPLIAILGRVDPRKGIDLLVEAITHVSVDPLPCLAVVGNRFVGDDAWIRQLTRRAEEVLGDRVRFVDGRPDPEVVLRSVDVLVNASDHEPFGRTVLEAQASATPVIGTSGGGIPEFVSDGITGLLVPPRDAPAMTAALQRMLTDPELRDSVTEAALAQATRSYDVDGQAAKVAAVYRSALERS